MNSRRKITRVEIVRGAMELLDSGTLNALTVDQLAKHLRMSKSTLYKHFSSKEDLLAEVVQTVCSETESHLSQLQEPMDLAPGLEAFTQVVAGHAERLPRAMYISCDSLPPKCSARLLENRAALEMGCESLVRRNEESGGVRQGQSRLFASCYMAAAQAAVVQAIQGGEPESRAAAVQSVHALMAPGIQA